MELARLQNYCIIFGLPRANLYPIKVETETLGGWPEPAQCNAHVRALRICLAVAQINHNFAFHVFRYTK